MTGGDYLKLNLIYVGKPDGPVGMLNHDYLFHTEMRGDKGQRIAQLDFTSGWILSEIWTRRKYPKMLAKFGSKMRRQGFSLLGRVVNEGNADENNYVDIWATNKSHFPPGVDAEPLGPLDISDPPKEMDGVFGGYCRINLGQQVVTETLMTHGYRYARGHVHIPSTDPLSKFYIA